MTKRKILWLITFVIMAVIISVACKKKPTSTVNFTAVEEAPGQEGETPQPEKNYLSTQIRD